MVHSDIIPPGRWNVSTFAAYSQTIFLWSVACLFFIQYQGLHQDSLGFRLAAARWACELLSDWLIVFNNAHLPARIFSYLNREMLEERCSVFLLWNDSGLTVCGCEGRDVLYSKWPSNKSCKYLCSRMKECVFMSVRLHDVLVQENRFVVK